MSLDKTRKLNKLFVDDVEIIPLKNNSEISLQEKTIEPSINEQNVTADNGFDGLSKVKVKAVIPSDYYKTEEILNVTPKTTEQTLKPSENNVYNEVNISAVTSAIDSNIIPTNIRKGKTILGVVGNLDEMVAPTLQEKSVTPTITSQRVTADAGYDGLAEVNVQAVTSSVDENIIPTNIRRGTTILGVQGNLDADKPDQSKTVTPTTSQQNIVADTGYELAQVTVNAVTSDIDANIQEGNIKEGVTILGKTGTFKGGIQPTGTIQITENNKTYDVTNYASAEVNVPSQTPNLVTKEITENGTYNASDDGADGYSIVTVDVAGSGGLNDLMLMGKWAGVSYDQNYQLLGETCVWFESDNKYTFTIEGSAALGGQYIIDGDNVILAGGEAYLAYDSNTGTLSMEEGAVVFTKVGFRGGQPIKVSKESAMSTLADSTNAGIIYEFIGTSDTYETGALYIVSEV